MTFWFLDCHPMMAFVCDSSHGPAFMKCFGPNYCIYFCNLPLRKLPLFRPESAKRHPVNWQQLICTINQVLLLTRSFRQRYCCCLSLQLLLRTGPKHLIRSLTLFYAVNSSDLSFSCTLSEFSLLSQFLSSHPKCLVKAVGMHAT